MGAKFGKTLVMNRCVKYFISIYKLSKSSFNNGWRSTSEDSRNKIKELFNCIARCSLIRYYMYMYMLEINMQQIIESDVERDCGVSSIIKGSLTGAELLNNIEMYCHRTGAKFGKTSDMNRCVKYFISINKLSKSSFNNGWRSTSEESRNTVKEHFNRYRMFENTSCAIMTGFRRLSFQLCFWSPYLYSKE